MSLDHHFRTSTYVFGRILCWSHDHGHKLDNRPWIVCFVGIGNIFVIGIRWTHVQALYRHVCKLSRWIFLCRLVFGCVLLSKRKDRFVNLWNGKVPSSLELSTYLRNRITPDQNKIIQESEIRIIPLSFGSSRRKAEKCSNTLTVCRTILILKNQIVYLRHLGLKIGGFVGRMIGLPSASVSGK